jgi:hypothetical protein
MAHIFTYHGHPQVANIAMILSKNGLAGYALIAEEQYERK